MSGSLREFVRSVLVEGSQVSGKTTRQWWADKGVTYAGEQADQTYFVLTDASGNEITGNVTFPGDPYTYRTLSSGRLQVVSGPTQKSIGAVIQKSTGSKEDKKDEAGAADKNLEKVKSFAVQVTDALADIVHAASELELLKNDFLKHQDSITPTGIAQLNLGLPGQFFVNLGRDISQIDMGSALFDSSKKERLKALLSSIADQAGDSPEAIKEINTADSSSHVRGRLINARIKLLKAVGDLDKIDISKIPEDGKKSLASADQMADFAGDVLSSDDVLEYFSANIIKPGGGQYIKAVVSTTMKPERIGGYAPYSLRAETEKLNQSLRDEILGVPQ